MDTLEKEIYSRLANFYCPESVKFNVQGSLIGQNVAPGGHPFNGMHSSIGGASIERGYLYAKTEIAQIQTDLMLKRTRELTMNDPFTALEGLGPNLFLVGTMVNSVIEFNIDLQKKHTFTNLHLNKITVLRALQSRPDQSPQFFLSGSDDHLIKLNSREKHLTVQTFIGNDAAITDLSYNSRNDIFLSANRSGYAHLWSQKVARPLCQYSPETVLSTPVHTMVSFVPESTHFFLASGTFLSIWDLRYNSRPIVRLNALSSSVEQIAFLTASRHVVNYNEEPSNDKSEVSEWAVLTGKGLYKVKMGQNPHILQARKDITSVTTCCMFSCSLTINDCYSEETPCLLLINNKGQQKPSNDDTTMLPATILKQTDFNHQLNYTCKRPHNFITHLLGAYLPSSTQDATNQGILLLASKSNTIQLYRISKNHKYIQA